MVRVGVRVGVRCREFIIMINSKCAANRTCLRIYSYSKFKGGAHAGISTLGSGIIYRDILKTEAVNGNAEHVKSPLF